MRKLLFVLMLLVAISSFPFFIGVEGITVPPVTLSATPSLLTLNARVDLGIFYLTLPVAEVWEDGSFTTATLDPDFVMNYLNVGVAFKLKLLNLVYARLGADLPLMNLITTQTFQTLDLKAGVGVKFMFLGLEGGVVGRLEKLGDGSLDLNFGNIFYIALGAEF
ncbi:MAG: hypothetical protein H0Z24_09730 [Thermosipho sp. (in: Bacteria)]|nr:hypothetical protein [Thermosipho sp. (in: thermotogales)]